MQTVEQYWESYERYGFIKEQTPEGYRYRLPSHLGEGGFELWGDVSTCMVCLSDVVFYKPCVSFEAANEKILEFGQYYCGDVSFYQKREQTFPIDHGLNYLVNYPSITGYKRMEANTRLTCIGLAYREKFFDTLPYDLPDDFWESAAEVLNPEAITLPSVTLICEQLRNCRLKGTQLKLFVQGKALEAFAVTLEYIYANRKKPAIHLTAQDRAALDAIKAILGREMAHPSQIKDMASSLGMNQQKLMAGFKQLNGMTVYTYLKRIRMQKAVELLQQNEMPITMIARAVGYHGDGHFQQAFKDVYGTTPSRLRQDFFTAQYIDDEEGVI